MKQTILPLGLAGIAGMLIEIASRDLSSIDGAFGVSSPEWSIICFASGVLFATLAAWRSRSSSQGVQTPNTPD